MNLLGKRELKTYGTKSLAQIKTWTNAMLSKVPVSLTWYQSNSESEILEFLHKIKENKKFQGIIINPAGLSHTSVVLLDALLAIEHIPIIEVHLTNPCSREEFRRQLLTAKASTMIMGGLGFQVYYFAALALYKVISQEA